MDCAAQNSQMQITATNAMEFRIRLLMFSAAYQH